MASMHISLPDLMRDYVQDRIDSGLYGSVSDYVRDLISRDQGRLEDEKGWLRELDATLAESLAEMGAGQGIDLDAACETVSAGLQQRYGNTDR